MTDRPFIPPPPNYPPTIDAPAPDWWDALYDEAAESDVYEPEAAGTSGGLRARVQSVWRHRGARRAAFFGTAAYTGWLYGIPQWIHLHITTFGEQDSIGGGILIGGMIIGACFVPAALARNIGTFLDALASRALRHQVRLFDPTFGWVGSIPLASAVVALASYTPAAPNGL